MKTAVYPGTFNPITNGHTDLVERAAGLFDHIIVGVVGSNRQKSSAMPTDQRVELAQEVLGHLPNVEVRSFESLLIQFVQEVDSKISLRGLRTVADFDYEFQLAGMNRRLAPAIDTVFLNTLDVYQCISSTLVREISTLGGDVEQFVSPRVFQYMQAHSAN